MGGGVTWRSNLAVAFPNKGHSSTLYKKITSERGQPLHKGQNDCVLYLEVLLNASIHYFAIHFVT